MTLEAIENDASEFIDHVQRIVTGLVHSVAPPEYAVVRVDNWFGDRWVGFSGKIMGAAGVRKRKLTIPPFVLSRIDTGAFYRRAGTTEEYERVRWPRWLHSSQPSGENLQNFVEIRSPKGLFIWFSSQSGVTGQGSIMAYVPSPEGHVPWYAGYSQGEIWRLTKAVGVTQRELDEIESIGSAAP